jgi:hypothetical protein
MRGRIRDPILISAAVLFGACAVRLGGPAPEEYTAVAVTAGTAETPAQAAAQLKAAAAELVLLAADRDTAWFQEVATAAGLTLSGPGRTGPRALGFLSKLEILGDTSIVLNVTEGGRIHMHDALYRVDKTRNIDLMLVRFEDTPDLRAAVRTLFGYIATDVGASVSVLLAIDAATPQLADSAAILMRAHYGSAVECADDDAAATPAAVTPPLQLVYGPSARLACRSARVLPGVPPAIQARVVVNR